jgi:hypothetical protein
MKPIKENIQEATFMVVFVQCGMQIPIIMNYMVNERRRQGLEDHLLGITVGMVQGSGA